MAMPDWRFAPAGGGAGRNRPSAHRDHSRNGATRACRPAQSSALLRGNWPRVEARAAGGSHRLSFQFLQGTAPRAMMMHWLPVAKDFRGDLKSAQAAPDLPSRLEKLAALAQHRLGF